MSDDTKLAQSEKKPSFGKELLILLITSGFLVFLIGMLQKRAEVNIQKSREHHVCYRLGKGIAIIREWQEYFDFDQQMSNLTEHKNFDYGMSLVNSKVEELILLQPRVEQLNLKMDLVKTVNSLKGSGINGINAFIEEIYKQIETEKTLTHCTYFLTGLSVKTVGYLKEILQTPFATQVAREALEKNMRALRESAKQFDIDPRTKNLEVSIDVYLENYFKKRYGN